LFVDIVFMLILLRKILEDDNNTTITQTGGVIRPEGQTNLNNLQAGQFVEF